MGLLGRKISDRFPVERWQNLPTMIGAGAIFSARKAQIDPDTLIMSRFFSGYLMGYPHYVDRVDENYGAAIRKLLFIRFYGDNADQVVRRVNGFGLLEDRQTKRGWDGGSTDGTRFLQALDERRDADGSLDMLSSAIETGFLIDLSQSIFD